MSSTGWDGYPDREDYDEAADPYGEEPMPEPGPPCGARMANPSRPGHRRPHLGPHLCVAQPHVGTVWHGCWCGYQWGEVEP